MARELLVKKIEGSIVELVNAAARRRPFSKNIFTNRDIELTNKFQGLSIPTVVGSQSIVQKAELRRKTVWQKLEEGWIKINFDGASCGNPGLVGIGCVARNSEGEVVEQKAKFIG